MNKPADFIFLKDASVQQQDNTNNSDSGIVNTVVNKTETPQTIGAISYSIAKPVLPDTIHGNQINNSFVFSDNDSLSPVDNYTGTSTNQVLFEGHLLQPSVTNPLPVKRSTPDWFTIILFLIIGFFTWLKVINNKIIRQLFAAGFSNSVTNQIVRDENILVQRASVLLSLVFYFSGALFLYQVSVYYHWNYKLISSGFARFFIFVLFIASAYSFKMVFLKLLSIILRIDKAVSTYIFNIFLINNITGIALIPIVILMAFLSGYAQYFIWLGLAILLLSFFYRLFRGITIWAGMSHASLYYLFLYLCALEIAPLLILFKIA